LRAGCALVVATTLGCGGSGSEGILSSDAGVDGLDGGQFPAPIVAGSADASSADSTVEDSAVDATLDQSSADSVVASADSIVASADSGGTGADGAVADAKPPCPDSSVTNPCGGCGTLPNYGQSCGCGGKYQCNGADATSCQGAAAPNPCGGCTSLPNYGQHCGCGGSGTYRCNGANATSCQGACANGPCCNAQNGVYCGYSTADRFAGTTGASGLYYCSGGCTTSVVSCSNFNCRINPSGADECCGHGTSCGTGVCGESCSDTNDPNYCCDQGLTCISKNPADCE
jgi:hypothetical protein